MPSTTITIKLNPTDYQVLKEQLAIRLEDLKDEEKDADGQERQEMRAIILHLEKLGENI